MESIFRRMIKKLGYMNNSHIYARGEYEFISAVKIRFVQEFMFEILIQRKKLKAEKGHNRSY